MDTEKKEERLVEEQLTPTKKGKGGSRAELLVPDEEVSILLKKERISTRYVMVEGVDKHSSEKDLRYTLIVSSLIPLMSTLCIVTDFPSLPIDSSQVAQSQGMLYFSLIFRRNRCARLSRCSRFGFSD